MSQTFPSPYRMLLDFNTFRMETLHLLILSHISKLLVTRRVLTLLETLLSLYFRVTVNLQEPVLTAVSLTRCTIFFVSFPMQ